MTLQVHIGTARTGERHLNNLAPQTWVEIQGLVPQAWVSIHPFDASEERP